MTITVNVPLEEWKTALKPFLKTKAPKRGESGEVMLTLEKGQIVFRYGGLETTAAAEGNWPGAAFVFRMNILQIAQVPPLKDPVVVEVTGERIKIEGFRTDCRWTPAGKASLPAFENEPPAPKHVKDTTFPTLVSMGLDYSPDKVASLGLTVQVDAAKRKKDQLVEEAAQILAPLGITAADLQMLVKSARGFKMFR